MEYETDPHASSVSFQEYLAILKRRRSLLLQAFVLISLVGVIVTFLTKPVYQAQGKLLVDAPSNVMSTINTDSPLSGLFGIGSQQSPDTVAEVLQTLPLQQQVFQKDGQVVFGVTPTPNTNIIAVQAEAGDARTAASAVNDLMQSYIQQSSDQSVADMEKAYQFAKQQSDIAHGNLAKSENALRAFQERYHIASLTEDRSNQISLVSRLSQEVQGQEAALSALQAKLIADRAMLGQEPSAITNVLPSTNPTIETLKQAIVTLQVQRKALTQPGGLNPNGRAPVLLQIDAEIAEYRRQIALLPKLLPNQASNINSVRENLRGSVANLQGDLRATRAQLADTRVNLAHERSDLGRYPDRALSLDRLMRSRDTAAHSAQMFDGELSDLSLREKARHASAHIIEPATYYSAQSPVRPKKALNIIFSCLIGLFIGICLALLQEFLDDRINTVEDSDRVLGLPSLGRVPALTVDGARLLPQMTGSDPASESYRILRTNIHFASVDAPFKTLLVTSSSPGEGKTTTAVNLAFAMAMDGKKVILVDSDLRRPTIHKMLGLPTMPGLTDVLAGTARLDDVLMQHSEMPNLMALSCGTTPPNPSELLGSRAFRGLLETLSAQSDVVIMDSPPVLAAADAQILASEVDGVVLVVETGETRKVAARQTLALLRHARANILGVTYNKLSTHSGDGYYYQYAAALTDGSANGTGKSGKRGRKILSDSTENPTEGDTQ